MIIQDKLRTDTLTYNVLDETTKLTHQILKSNNIRLSADKLGKFISIVQAISLSNYDYFDIDKAMTSDGMFGCDELFSQVKYLSSRFENLGKVDMKSNLLAKGTRDISLKKYLSLDSYMNEDLKHLEDLMGINSDENKHEANSEKPLEELLESGSLSDILERFYDEDSFIQDLLNRYVTSTLLVYSKMFGSGFELSENYGVLDLKSKSVLRLGQGEDSRKVYKEVSVSFSRLAESVQPFLDKGFICSNEYRQFNVELILKNKGKVYFPKKILEYALGRVTTRLCNHDEYKRFDGGSGWDSYARNYIDANLRYFFRKAISYALTSNYSEEWIKNLVSNKEEVINNASLFEQVMDMCYTSFTSGVLVTEVTGDVQNWASIEFRINEHLFANGRHANSTVLIGKVIEIARQGQGSASGDTYDIEPEFVDEVGNGNNIITYRHVFDAKLANKVPLFAYQALDAMSKRGEKLSWFNILLGKGKDGKIVAINENSRIELVRKLFHWLNAGSRSGKGVMTYNLLASALASSIPAFYLDNKPDMCATLNDVSKEFNQPNMFLINGKSYEKQFDISGNFDMNSPQLSSLWRNTIPSFWNANSYEDIGDLVYYRAVIFVLGVLQLRFWAKANNPSLYQQLNGDEGIVAFFDEFTKFQNNFTTVRLNPRGNYKSFLNENVFIPKNTLKEYKGWVEDLELLRSKDEDDLKLNDRKRIRDLENKIAEVRDEYRAYATDLYLNLERTIDSLYDKKNAGFKNKEEFYSNIFIIGQDLETKPLPDGLRKFSMRNSGGFNNNASLNNSCILTTFFLDFSSDFIMGYNSSHPEYMKANATGSKTKDSLTQEARNFAYINATYETVKGNCEVSTINSEAHLFKPYLILNNSNEPQLDRNVPISEQTSKLDQPECQYVGGVIKLIGKEWWDARKGLEDKNAPEVNGQKPIRKEIGFKDYISSVSRLNNAEINFNKSGEIADLIVKQMGYSGNWQEFMCDLRPEWNFGADDLVDAFAYPEIFKSGERRISTYLELFGTKEKDNINEDTYISDDGMESVYDSSNVDVPSNNSNLDGSNLADNELDEDNYNVYADYDDTWGDDEINLDETSSSSSESDEDYNIYDEYNGSFSDESSGLGLNEGTELENEPSSVGSMSNSEWGTQDSIRNLEQSVNQTKEDISQTIDGLSRRDKRNSGMSRVERYKALRDEINGVQSIEITNPNSDNEGFMLSYYGLIQIVTDDIIKTVGGLDNVETLAVKGGMLVINGLRYSKKFPLNLVKGLPRDRAKEITEGKYANLFNFNSLLQMPHLHSLSIDSASMLNTKIAKELGTRTGEKSIVDLYNKLGNLYYLTINNQEFTRDSVHDKIVRNQNFFRSQEKRSMYADKFYEKGRKLRSNSFDTSKELYSRNGFWNKLGGVGMFTFGATTATVLGGMKLGRGAKKLFKTAFDAIKEHK